MITKKFLFLILFIISILSNLHAESIKKVNYIESSSDDTLIIIKNEEWRNVDIGLNFKTIRLTRGKGKLNIVIKLLKIEPELIGTRVIYNPEVPAINLKSIAEKNGAIAAINGSFFDINGKPLGLLISDGQTINGKIATHFLYSGIFYVKDNIPRIAYRENFSPIGIKHAVQVGPLLVMDGKGIEGIKDIHSINYRSGIAMDGFNKIIIYATDTQYNGVSWHELMQLMRFPDINCLHVLNLDGGGSTQMFISTPLFSDYIEGKTGIPVAIGFYRR
ncbi:MAG: hypothetical protein A3I04_08320 [Nitrospinae bacterium RIFCSPLOWO2_02_FULL_39_110]|nr:MAG: hypothetical protein A2W53_05370 [Nitrospinae bacterium RIFCSPHIGHO2_02_39_11]OGW00232.1 MAG: hypothetical protein A3D97_00995 [Nitrospinae bacterium RIFCSPHIGHO2_12_FULL_39_42]OGW03034.1 MAG: hypothetical protein A3D20_05905 [Nitrospinae bacterium RIFCSPHIGHO2_02_FULL_39_82]OGW06147.1 MAG: hypothetical protein A2Z59_07090 [Nitrospinae bacterium RIFCSPLOWO2_02_39_17]OGW07052.1 MAG: hypothetical protein A3I04_08320 [Nitrospinae bacterium RIFCSPLOWO2_02_FULL_39_110]OGW07806.1 MAG: hypoth